MGQHTPDELVIVPGADVVGSEGDKIGTVKEVFPDYITVEKGWFFPSDHYIPASAINDANADTVFLNVTKDEALKRGWEHPPTAVADTATETPTNRATVTDTEVTGGPSQPFARSGADVSGEQHLDVDENETIRVPLAEEELTATKRPVERGAVRVTKDVVEEEKTLDVPVSEEHVNVERRVVDRHVAPGETAFEEGEIDVPVRGEEVDVQKRARVGEELDITKDATQRTQQVSDTVRKERAHVENTTDDVVDNVDRTTDYDTDNESLIDKAKDTVEDISDRDRR